MLETERMIPILTQTGRGKKPNTQYDNTNRVELIIIADQLITSSEFVEVLSDLKGDVI